MNNNKPYDKVIEYLEVAYNSDGKYCWIDTLFIPNSDDLEFYITFLPIKRHHNYSVIFTNGVNSSVYYRIVMWDSFPAYANYGTPDAQGGALPNLLGVKFSAELRNVECVIDGISYELPAYQNKENTASITLFNRYTQDRQISGRLYSFKIKKSGKTILDLIPVRKGNEGFMYDRVSGKLYGNAGDPGSRFILGPDIQ